MNEGTPEAPNREVRTGSRVLSCALLALVVTIVAAVVVPAYLRSRISGPAHPHNSLRSIATAQEQFRRQVVVDQDQDQAGEYGWLGELSGAQPVRVSGLQMNTSPFVAAILGVKDAGGRAQKSGYYFQIWLQDAAGKWMPEPAGQGATPNAANAADHQERRWICYAWPVTYGQSGESAFVIDQNGELWHTRYEPGVGAGGPYTGVANPPTAMAAFTPDGSHIADGSQGQRGQDGRLWLPARG